jgi:teichuronic acid biosynthesis glycosyltransferase TuaC
MRVLVVAEWYPSPADPVHGIWAHRQALAVREAGAQVRVLALRRPVPPIAVARAGPAAIARWTRSAPAMLRPRELDGLHIQPVPFLAPPRPLSYGSWGAWIAPFLRRALARERFDLVHAHNVLPTGDAILRARNAPRFVLSTHGPDIIHVAGRSRASAKATRRTLRHAAVVIANSNWAAKRCEQLAGGPLPCQVVHLGADMRPPSLEHSQRPPTIITVAHLQRRKRHAVVMAALASLAKPQRPDYVIVGDGEMRRPLEALREQLGLKESVRFLGQLDHQQALAEIARAHLLVMPSVEEPFGVAYVEAMAAGVPAIGCQSEGGPQDIAAAGEGIVLVPADDEHALAAAIQSCLRDRDRLACAARETVERHFTWQRCGERTLAAYEEALK